jgi:hypothetical protein
VVVILVSHSRYADFCTKIGMPLFEITVNAYLPYLIALIQAAIASITPGMNSSIAQKIIASPPRSSANVPEL